MNIFLSFWRLSGLKRLEKARDVGPASLLWCNSVNQTLYILQEFGGNCVSLHQWQVVFYFLLFFNILFIIFPLDSQYIYLFNSSVWRWFEPETLQRFLFVSSISMRIWKHVCMHAHGYLWRHKSTPWRRRRSSTWAWSSWPSMHVHEETPWWDGLEWDTCSIWFLLQATIVEYKLLVAYVHKTCIGNLFL